MSEKSSANGSAMVGGGGGGKSYSFCTGQDCCTGGVAAVGGGGRGCRAYGGGLPLYCCLRLGRPLGWCGCSMYG